MISHIIFDFGGVIFPLNYDRAVQRFKKIGLVEADNILDKYKQKGFFGQLEIGDITPEEFRKKLSNLANKDISLQECQYAWMGYVDNIPPNIFQTLKQLKQKGYNISLLSNINPFIMDWAFKNGFDQQGHNINYYFNHLFLSYECRIMKPEKSFFQFVLKTLNIQPHQILFIDDGPQNIEIANTLGFQTFHSKNYGDWITNIINLPHI